MMTTLASSTRSSALWLLAAASGSIALTLLATGCNQPDPARGSLIPSASGGGTGTTTGRATAGPIGGTGTGGTGRGLSAGGSSGGSGVSGGGSAGGGR